MKYEQVISLGTAYCRQQVQTILRYEHKFYIKYSPGCAERAHMYSGSLECRGNVGSKSAYSVFNMYFILAIPLQFIFK